MILNIPSTNTPLTIPLFGEAGNLGINNEADAEMAVTDARTLISMDIDVNITPPDEGFGPDATLLKILLFENFPVGSTIVYDGSGGNRGAILANGSALSLTSTNFEKIRSSQDLLSTFYGFSLYNTGWVLVAQNSSTLARGTITSCQLNLNVVDNPPPGPPNGPVPRTLPTAAYGIGGNVARNDNVFFKVTNPVTGGVLDTVRLVPYNAYVKSLKISAISTGSGNTLTLSLHKVSSTVDTVVISRTVALNAGLSFAGSSFDSNIPVSLNDMLYLSIDDAGTGVSKIEVQLSLVAR